MAVSSQTSCLFLFSFLSCLFRECSFLIFWMTTCSSFNMWSVISLKAFEAQLSRASHDQMMGKRDKKGELIFLFQLGYRIFSLLILIVFTHLFCLLWWAQHIPHDHVCSGDMLWESVLSLHHVWISDWTQAWQQMYLPTVLLTSPEFFFDCYRISREQST